MHHTELMKSIGLLAHGMRLSVIFILLAGHVIAFDPAGAPPRWTQANTVAFLGRVVLPQAKFHQATAAEALAFALSDRPPAYKPVLEVDTSLQNSTARFDIDENDITLLELLGRIAEKSQADLLISPGKVTLIPRKPSSALSKP